MKTFKDFVIEDNKVFFNANEFSELKEVAGSLCKIVFIDESNKNGDNRLDDNYINSLNFSFSVLKKEIGFKPMTDRQMSFDNRNYTVVKVIDNGDTYDITLSVNED